MIAPAPTFNLFDAEDKALAEAEDLSRQVDRLPSDLKGGIENLIASYRSVINEQRRLVRLSDRQQSQVAKLNKELAKRTTEAEEALFQLKATQDQLVQAEKLASLGALVGGVAHEINTPVGVALSCASHLAETTERLRELYEADNVGVDDFENFLTQTIKASALVMDNCQRAAQLIGSFKRVAVDRISDERLIFDMREKINETLTSLGPQINAPGHQVILECPTGLLVDGYPGVLSQIVSNLVMNAIIHGFDSAMKGCMTINVALSDESWINFDFTDNGKGISAKNLDRVFDPFFTTKMGQGGSGLGLNIVYNLVTGPLGGVITVDSPPGKGAHFRIRFPSVAPH